MSKNKDTLKTYEKISQKYAEMNQSNDAVLLQRELFSSFLKEGIIYDFGCGTGRDIYAFSQMGYKVKGFDGSESMLNIAKEFYPDGSFNKLDMLSANWNITQNPDGIWACASLLHFEKDDFVNVFDKLIHLLRDNGIFYFSLKIKSMLYNEIIDGRFFQYYTKEWLDDFIKNKNNLEILHYEENNGRIDCFASYFLKKI